jgi:hypothetical protein
MKTNKLVLLAFSAFILSAAACGSDSTTPPKDGGSDAKRDTAPAADTGSTPDTGGTPDVATDTAPKLDVAADVAPDAPKDGGLDTAPDTAVDTAVDSAPLDGRDAASDVAAVDGADGAADTGADSSDAVTDVGPDGPPPCTTGAACAPLLGAQIDRMGRAGVNTALTDPFWDDGTQTDTDHRIKLDKYNAANNPATWKDVELAPGKKTSDLIKGNLAVYDALSGTGNGTMTDDGCGSQLAFGANYRGTVYPNYTLLTTVLTDDRLYVNTGSGTCSTYLAVEAAELGIANTDCGGRTPTYNTIDITYSALATTTAVCTTACPVSSGVTADADKGAGYSETAFPFLGTPIP